jgi:hypothetical protein
MKEKLKEWLLRKLLVDLITRGYGTHLFAIIVEEHLDHFPEDSLRTIRAHVHNLVDQGVARVSIGADPLL